MGDYLDRMDSLYGYDDPVTYSNEELKKYRTYHVPHYYEMSFDINGIEVNDRGTIMVYEDKDHRKYHMTYEGLEQFGTFRFDYFMVTLNPDRGHFKRMVIDRMKVQKKAAYLEYRAEAKRIDEYIAAVEACEE